jgi:hypothetical protein
MKKMIMSDVPGEKEGEGASDSDSLSQYQDMDDKEPQVWDCCYWYMSYAYV